MSCQIRLRYASDVMRRQFMLTAVLFLLPLYAVSARGGLVGYWPLNDDPGGPSGTVTSVADSSGNSNTGTILGLGSTVHWDGSSSGVSGNAGDNSLEFTSQDDAHFVDIPNSSSLDITGDGLTLSLWLQTLAIAPQNVDVLSKGGLGGAYSLFLNSFNDGNPEVGFAVQTHAGGQFFESLSLSPGDPNRHPLPLNSSGWEHVAFTYDATTGIGTTYVNGSQVFQGSGGGGIASNGSSVQLGTGYRGGLDDVSIWDEALTPGEIQALASGASPLSLLNTSLIEWNVDALGDWNTASNWSPTVAPNFDFTTVRFGPQITAPRSVVTDLPRTVRAIQFESGQSYGITGQGEVNLVAGSGSSRIDVLAGDHQFQLPVNLRSDVTVEIASANSLTFNHALNLLGNTLTKSGNGTMTINNVLNTGGGSLILVEGVISGNGTVGGDVANEGGIISPGSSQGQLSVIPEPASGLLVLFASLVCSLYRCRTRA